VSIHFYTRCSASPITQPEKWISQDWFLHHVNGSAHSAFFCARISGQKLQELFPTYHIFLCEKLKLVFKGKRFDYAIKIKEKQQTTLAEFRKQDFRCFTQ
jgi:hypothetical protein